MVVVASHEGGEDLEEAGMGPLVARTEVVSEDGVGVDMRHTEQAERIGSSSQSYHK